MTDPHRPARRGRKWSPEMITATAAVVIGVSALFVSLYETSLVREHQRASVWPHFEGGISWDGRTFRVLVENTGIGPSRIEQLIIRVDGEPVGDWTEFFDVAGVPVTRFLQSQVSGRVLLPGSPQEVLVVDDPEFVHAVAERWAGVTVEACYCSIFDECWETDLGEIRRAVRRCSLDPATTFRQ